MSEFVLGADITLAFTVDGEDQEAIIDGVESFSSTVDIRMVEENIHNRPGRYVTTIFDGLSGNISLKIKDPRVFDFVLTLQRKAAREVYGVTVNVMEVVTFPESGEVRTLLYRGLEFGSIPSDWSRDTHKSLSLTWSSGAKLQVISG